MSDLPARLQAVGLWTERHQQALARFSFVTAADVIYAFAGKRENVEARGGELGAM